MVASGEKPKDLLLLAWVHGFKGNEVTFEGFPDRISHLLSVTHPSLHVVSRVAPTYETKGDLNAATLAFVDWLSGEVVQLENDGGQGGGAGRARVVLMGHSMGGLLIADAARDVVKNTREGDPLWPNVVGIVAFDTPYLGLHPHTFKHGFTTAASYYEQARSVASTLGVLSPMAIGLGFGKWGKKDETNAEAGPSKPRAPSPKPPKGKSTSKFTTVVPPSTSPATDGIEPTNSTKSWWSTIPIPAVTAPSNKTLYGIGAAAVAAGAAYYTRDTFIGGWKWGFDHMTFVSNLWDDAANRERLDDIDRLRRERNIKFWNFYTHLPPLPPTHLVSRTFCILPPLSHPLYPHFVAQRNTIAADEISAHMGMFNPKTNDGFYDLGLDVVRGIGERIEEEGVGRGQVGLEEEEGYSGEWKEEKQGEKVVWVEQ